MKSNPLVLCASRSGRALLAVAALVATAFLFEPAQAQTAPTGSLTLATRANADGTLTPTLTWSTTPAATSCTATGDSAWAGTKAASGTQTLANFPASTPKTYLLVCNWPGENAAMLSWTRPTTFQPYDHDNNPSTPNQTDPLPLCAAATDAGPCLAKYRIVHGLSESALTDSRDHNFPNSTSATWSGLTAGTHYFAVRAVTGQGAESPLSNVVSKVTRDSVQWSQATGVRIPAAPAVTLATE